MSREIVACVTAQPESARASSSSNCVPTRLRETTLSIRRCRSLFANCIEREYVCRVSEDGDLVEHTFMLRKLLWTALYGALGAAATIVSRRTATGIWRTLTGEEPPTKK